MKHTVLLRLLIVILLAVPSASAAVLETSAPWTVCFTPPENCTDLLAKAIGKAKRSIHVQAYSFTSAPIAKALLQAHKRGVQVEVILDKSNQKDKYSTADFLENQDIPTFIDSAHAIAHNKIMIIDRETVVTGSFNFTKAAEQKNAENLILISDKALAARYLANWEMLLKHATRYIAKRIEKK
jgi:phosphatidylserine/phosphatidylglycerophosphate/cardiolipin synthase-like enzyme